MAEPSASYAFLPWLRRGVSADLRDAGTAAGRLELPIAVAFGQDREASLRVSLAGPGDVVGLDPRTVVRRWPPPGEREAEPNYFPLAEFDQADLPWRHSPVGSPAADRLRPWLCLIVLRDDEIGSLVPASGSRAVPVVTTQDAALPRLDQSWAWAHVQVAGTTSIEPGEAEELLREAPQRLVSRLLCPRRLDENTRYTAVLVPTFEAGRRAGLGLSAEAGAAPLAPAWTPGTASVQLPVYHRWHFSTGPEGDFESLVKRLQARGMPATAGLRDMDAADPGAGLPRAAREPLGLEGALSAPGMVPRPWPGDLRRPFADALAAFLNRPAALLAGGGGQPAVAPPLYGRWHAPRDTLAPGEPPPWFEAVNGDPRFRAAAGAGAQVVQANQRQLLAAAWQQVRGLADVNDALRLAQVARAVASRVHERHLATGDRDLVLQLTAPLHGHLRATAGTVAARLDASPIPGGVLGAGWRRVTRSLGPRPGVLSRLNQGELSPAPPPPTPSHMATVARAGANLVPRWATPAAIARGERLAGRIAAVGAASAAAVRGVRRQLGQVRVRMAVRDGRLTPATVTSVPVRPAFVATQSEILADGPGGAAVAGRPGEDSASAQAFRAATVALLDRVAAPLPRPAILEPAELDAVRGRVVAGLDPAVTIGASLGGRLKVAEALPWRPKDPLEPVLAGPDLTEPMYRPLAELSQEWLLPGLADVPPNTASLVTTNQPFIEAYMLGLNHEMDRELLWQEYPTDQRRTAFRQFWDPTGVSASGGAASAEAQLDIRPIHLWDASAALGENSGREAEQLVLLLRGDLMRRHPTLVVSAVRAVRADSGRRELGSEERHPRFTGRLEPDVAFYGFALTDEQVRGGPDADTGDPGWFFVLAERPGEPRFGLDVGEPGGVRPQSWNALQWGHLVPGGSELATLDYIDLDADLPDTWAIAKPADVAWHADRGLGRRGSRGSHLAFVTLQRPVRVAIHAAEMLAE